METTLFRYGDAERTCGRRMALRVLLATVIAGMVLLHCAATIRSQWIPSDLGVRYSKLCAIPSGDVYVSAHRTRLKIVTYDWEHFRWLGGQRCFYYLVAPDLPAPSKGWPLSDYDLMRFSLDCGFWGHRYDYWEKTHAVDATVLAVRQKEIRELLKDWVRGEASE